VENTNSNLLGNAALRSLNHHAGIMLLEKQLLKSKDEVRSSVSLLFVIAPKLASDIFGTLL